MTYFGVKNDLISGPLAPATSDRVERTREGGQVKYLATFETAGGSREPEMSWHTRDRANIFGSPLRAVREAFMDPIDRLGPNLQHAGHDYELWLQRVHWFLYRGEPNGTSFRFFVIIRADREPRPAKSEIQYRLKKANENVNVCGPFFCNQWVARDKFLKLSRGETSSMKYRSQDRQQQVRLGVVCRETDPCRPADPFPANGVPPTDDSMH